MQRGLDFNQLVIKIEAFGKELADAEESSGSPINKLTKNPSLFKKGEISRQNSSSLNPLFSRQNTNIFKTNKMAAMKQKEAEEKERKREE